MSLTQEDLQQICYIVHEEVDYLVDKRTQPITAEIQALRNDVLEIYDMITDLQKIG